MNEHGGSRTWARWTVIGLVLLICAPTATHGQVTALQGATAATAGVDNPIGVPDVRSLLPVATDSQGISSTLQIMVILTVLTLVPSILIMMTCFARIIIVLALMRQAIGVPQLPPGQVLMGLSLFITMLIMAPTWLRIKADAVDPYLNNQTTQQQALESSVGHLRDFMFAQITKTGNEAEVFLFLDYYRGEPTEDTNVDFADVPTTVLIPAFILSELKTAFIMGFRIYLPFLVIDMVIASILISMGMMMLPPVLISLPFKLLLFVLANGWHLVIGTLLDSFEVT